MKGAVESRSTSRLRYECPEAVFRAHYRPLSQALAVVSGDTGVAEDTVQEAFTRLYLNRRKVAHYEDQVGWVRRVAVNLIRDRHRFLRRQARLILRMGEETGPVTRTKTADGPLWQAVRRLPLKQRIAVALYYVADLSVADVAEAMGISQGAALKHLDRARSRLRTTLEVRGS